MCPERNSSSPLQALGELLGAERLQPLGIGEVCAHELPDLSELPSGDVLEAAKKVVHGGIGQTVVDVRPVPARRHQGGGTQGAEVGAGVLHAEPGLMCERLHGLLALGEKVEDLEARRAGGGLSHPCELLEQGLFRGMGHGG
jgi:hypothetical protein